MKLRFHGVGEAFDPERGTSCYLLEVSEGHSLLVDCGYACLDTLFTEDINKISLVYITHFHADHVFGLPALLFQMFILGRKEELTILSQVGSEKKVRELCEKAFPGMLKLLSYPLVFVEEENEAQFFGMRFRFAETNHSLRNLALRVDKDDVSLSFSGDGALTEAAEELYRGSRFVVHEGFSLEETVYGHESVRNVLNCCSSAERLFLVHISRAERDSVEALAKSNELILVPARGDQICLL